MAALRHTLNNVAGEIVENGLPPSLLLLDGVRRFAVKGDADDDAFGVRGELDLRHAIAERILDQLMLDDLRVGPGEIEAHAAVLGLHARGEGAALAQVNGGSCRMPVIRCGVPLLDLRGRRIGPPDLLDGCRDSGFDVDLHRCGSSRKLVAGTGSVRRVHSPVLNSCLSQAEPLNSRQIHYEGSRDPQAQPPFGLPHYASPVGASWMWTLALGHHEDRTPTHGYAATREDAMAAFAKSWRRE